ncbi:MAG: DUF2207 domain-containing protein [Crocinitomicaceae bacterium]|nr:DUF2207 domain-containing protein [Crocinitomicaceae bacterium]
MKNLVFGLVLIVSSLSFAYEEERILKYHSHIEVLKSCDVIVTETIIVYSNNVDIRNGIFRELPLSYNYRGGEIEVGFELLEVKRNGKNEPFHTESMLNGIRIYAGDDARLVPVGVHKYEIIYKVNRVLGLFGGFDELYWNINGNKWNFSIDEISAEVHLPKGARVEQFAAYSGSYGENDKRFTMKKTEYGVSFNGTSKFLNGENLTVAVAWDKNHLEYPTGIDNFLYWLRSFALWIISGTGLFFGFIFNFWTWKKHGKDPKPGVIIPLFYAPEGFSPAECAYLENEGRKTNTMFGSTLMSLATKEYLKIEFESKGAIYTHSKYTITRLPKNPKQTLNHVESVFFRGLFKTRDVVIIENGKYNAEIAEVSRQLIASIDKKQNNIYFKRNLNLKGRQFLVPLIVGVIGTIVFFMFGGSLPILIGGFVTLIIMNMIFSRLYEQPTKRGRKKMDEILGFRMYMKYADKERIKVMNPPTMNFTHFEENLAYAIALGVAEEWAGQFDPLDLKEFRGGNMPYYYGMSTLNFNDFSQDLSSTISSASTPPGSNSGSSGGGFSGGGGGGGGGGGW